MITYLEQDFIDKAPQGEAVNTLIDLSGVSLITVPNYQKRLVIEVNSEYIYFSAATSGDVKPDVGVGYWNQYVVAATGNTVITGNTNEVVFNISGDTFGTDNNLYWDNATKKLGIGGIIPTRPLEVRASNGSLVGSTMTALVRISSPDEAGGFNMGYLNSEVIGAISSQGANSGLAFLTHNGVWDERIRIDTTGKVGIGTTSPNEGLEMGSDLRIRLPSPASFPTRPYLNIGARDAGDATALVFVEPSDDSELGGWIVGTGAMSFYTNSTSGRDIILTTVGSNDIYFKTNNVERLRIDSDGFVGINITSPTEKLDVSGNTNISGIYMVDGNQIGISDISGLTTALDTKADKNATVVSLSGSTTLDESYNNNIVEVSGSTGVTITLPTGVTEGWQVVIVNFGTEIVTIESENVLLSKNDANLLSSQYGAASAYFRNNVHVLFGDIT